jgi:hypothetical protein
VSAPPPIDAALGAYFEPADACWLHLHGGHLMFVREEERRLLSAEIIKTMSFTGTSDDLRGLRDAGYDQFTLQIVEGQENALEDWAGVLKPLGLGK